MQAHVGVIFELTRAKTSPGEAVRVVGERRELGRWDPSDGALRDALELKTSPLAYPRWCLPAPVWVEVDDVVDMPDLTLTYKYAIEGKHHAHDRPPIHWEQRAGNRSVTLPCRPGVVWLVTDVEFGDSGTHPQVNRASLSDIWRLQESIHDPRWLARSQLAAALSLSLSPREAFAPGPPALPRLPLPPSAQAVATFPMAVMTRACPAFHAQAISPRFTLDCASGEQAPAPASPASFGDRSAPWACAELESVASSRSSEASWSSSEDSLPALAPHELRAPRLEGDVLPRPPGPPAFWEWPLDREQRKTRVHMIDRKMLKLEHAARAKELTLDHAALVEEAADQHQVAMAELTAENEHLAAELKRLRSVGEGGRRDSLRRRAKNGGG